MANIFDEQLSRMSQLMFYGSGKDSNKNNAVSSVMNLKEGADGKVYGIVSEGTKYYIKSCKKGDEQLAESFDYIGGYLNRKSCEYSSYADAVKDMNMRLMSLNEDYGRRMPINEMKRSADFMDQDMVEMQESIQRHRQILENIDVIYQNKKSGIGDRNIGVPEAPKTQEYNTKVGDPFEDKADYEENRDNKETAKDHEKQGGPFEDETEYEESTDNIEKKDSNTPGDTYTDKPQYVPDNAVAAMHPEGGKVVRVNEDVNDLMGMYDGEDGPTNEPDWEDDEDNFVDETSDFPEENPDDTAAEFGEMGGDDLEDLENDEFLSQFSDDPDEENEFWAEMDGDPANRRSEYEGPDVSDEYVSDDNVAGIDDMSGVDRNNLSADIIDDVVSESVNNFIKGKKLDMISESVARAILNEGDDDKEYYHDTDFEYGNEDYDIPTPDSEYKASGLSQYMDKGSRKPNVTKNGVLDPRKGAPAYVNPAQVDYDPESEYYLQNKYELGLNDDPKAGYEESSAWKGTEEKARKYASARVEKAQKDLQDIGSELQIDTTKVVDIFRHALYVLQDAKNNFAIMIGAHPNMIERFLVGNTIPFKNIVATSEFGDPYGYKDAKETNRCIITADGELPLSEATGHNRFQNSNGDTVIEGLGIVGPSLKAMGFRDMPTEELRELVDDLLDWDKEFGANLEKEENVMRDAIEYVQGLADHKDAEYVPKLTNVVSEWTSLLEDIAGLQSLVALPCQVLNKREDCAQGLTKKSAYDADENDEEMDDKTPDDYSDDEIYAQIGKEGLREEKTVLHSFGDHPGYRKKPMSTPANSEVAPNGARDWNDESAKSEEPFGKQIGSSAPYNDIVDAVTKEVLKALKGGLN